MDKLATTIVSDDFPNEEMDPNQSVTASFIRTVRVLRRSAAIAGEAR